jgi:transcriptional regulator with XRE-family HTH domain
MDRMTFNRRIGKRIAWERKKQGLSQVDIAVSINTDAHQIIRIENGKISTSFYTVYRICQELDISIEKLMELWTPTNPPASSTSCLPD